MLVWIDSGVDMFKLPFIILIVRQAADQCSNGYDILTVNAPIINNEK